MSVLSFLFFVLVDIVVTLFLTRRFLSGGGVLRLMIAYALALGMGFIYMGVIRRNGLIQVDVERLGGGYLDLIFVHGGAFVMIYFHAWVTPSR